MKHRLCLAVVAILLVVLYAGTGAFLLLLVLPVAYFFLKRKEQGEQKGQEGAEPAPEKYTSLEAVVSEYGEPDDSVVINASKANEPSGIVLIYAEKGFLLADGEKIRLDEIVGITAKNTATPYTIGEYQIMFHTTIKGRELIRMNAGYDATWADEAVAQIHRYIAGA